MQLWNGEVEKERIKMRNSSKKTYNFIIIIITQAAKYNGNYLTLWKPCSDYEGTVVELPVVRW
jgi:putative lipoic acid-binding regulatory protein